jgi:hypothetical protein
MENCVVSGNTVYGGGAAGGGIFSVGGRDTGADISLISRSAITENRITGLFAYGAGVYSDGVTMGDVLGNATLSAVINSYGVQADPVAVLHYAPTGTALDQLPRASYNVTEVLGQLIGPQGEGGNPLLLPTMLNQIRDVFGQADFESDK